MMKSMAHLVPVFCILLTGCASQADKCAEPIPRGNCAPGTPAYEMQLHDETLATIDDARCRSFGDQPGSAAYARCRAAIRAARMPGTERSQQ